jgi:G3E family GTPase
VRSLGEKAKVTVLTGYLGCGKTTLLNHLLTQEAARDCAVIVNEFGEVSIDAQLLVGVDEDVVELNNGCICCTVRADLVTTIARLMEGPTPPRRLLVETTGLADPAPIIQSFVLDEQLRALTELDAVVTVVDARNNAAWLEMGVRDEEAGRENTPREQIAFADLILVSKGDLVDRDTLANCQREARRINPLARIKTIVDGLIAAEQVLDIAAFDLRNALKIEPELLSDLEHKHDDDIASVVVRPASDLDGDAFFKWLNSYVQAKGQELLRVKGIVALAGEARRYVFHGVHMTLDGRPGRAWAAGEVRAGEIVFIGRNLDRHAIDADIAACRAQAVAA